jgi:predicted RNase H-like nuclease (RuvC/YqgF family)
MATNYEYDDEDDDFGNEPQDVVKQLRKVNRTLEKRLKELEVEASTLKTQTRQRTVKDVLSAKGINPKVAAFIPQDIDTTEEAVSAWLAEYGDVFGVQQSPEATQAKETASDAQRRIQNVMQTGTPPGVDEDALARILNATSAADLSSILGVQTYN